MDSCRTLCNVCMSVDMYASLPTSWNVWDEPIVKQWRLNTVPQISDEFKVVKQRVLATCHPATDVNKVSVIV